MRRREFIAGLGSAAAWPIVAGAQQPAMPVVGYFNVAKEDSDRPLVAAYRRGFGEQGYVEGRNVEILYRYTEARRDRYPAVAEELVRDRVSVIYVGGGPLLVLAAKAATSTIPIVFVNGVDPVRSGLVASLNRPGGNVTGVTFLSQELTAKRLELLHEVVPAVTSIGFLVSPGDRLITEIEKAARILGVRLVIANASSPSEIDAAFAMLIGQQIGALLVGRQGLFFDQGPQLAASAARHKLPTIYASRESVEAGGLMSYGANLADATRIAGTYTGRILRGENPPDLPVQQSTKTELVINLKTAKALGLTFPETLSATADEVIQ
jgi:putative tryptophan/tyrosine transport system substrate-binding protein